MDDNKIVAFVKNQLYDWALGDVKRASAGGSKMGAFILASCAIDYLACFYFNQEATGDKYKDFCKIYFEKYNANDLYHSLRCKVIHNYREGGQYVFTDGNSNIHFHKQRDGQIILNLENFIEDIEKAMNKYFVDLEKDKILKENLVKRYNTVGILGLKTIDL